MGKNTNAFKQLLSLVIGVIRMLKTMSRLVPESEIPALRNSPISIHLLLLLLLSCALFMTGCSFLTDFVVVNNSDRPIEVRYRIRNSPSNLMLVCGTPAVTTSRQLKASDEKWEDLSVSQYQVNPENRLITVPLMPEQALRITSNRSAENRDWEIRQSEQFCADQIELLGAYGDIRLQGAQVYAGFSPVSKGLRTLTYQR
jgi:hypothetical protein